VRAQRAVSALDTKTFTQNLKTSNLNAYTLLRISYTLHLASQTLNHTPLNPYPLNSKP